jgi:hypothetical protein
MVSRSDQCAYLEAGCETGSSSKKMCEYGTESTSQGVVGE